MSTSRVQSEDQFLCSICLLVFTDPVTVPCGHNFCKACITEHWRIVVPCKCPLCKEVFHPRPQLKINTFISQVVGQFSKQDPHEKNSSSSEQQAAKPGEVPCDICTETKLKALKSCLVCLTSYCETHVEPHLTVPGLKRHQLINAVQNLEDRMCTKHDKPLELFCKTDQTCICVHCTILEHKTHKFLPLKDEYEGQKTEMKKAEDEIQQMIHERQLKIVELNQSVKLSKKAADRETAEGVQVFTALMESLQKSFNKLKDEIEEKHGRTEKQAVEFIKELEQEISELKKRSTEMEQLSHSEDPLQFLQTLMNTGKTAATMKSWINVSICQPSYEVTARTAVFQLADKLTEEMKKLKAKYELKRLQQFAVNVTLDPDTAHPNLVLSNDEKQVYYGDVRKNRPDNPARFSTSACVLAKQSFSSGRFYFEVQVKGKTKWNLGVARQSINRKGDISLKPQKGYWTIWLRNENEYEALAQPSVRLRLKSPPQKVGVFVDYEEGLVSFYDVDAASLIYSFTGCYFSDKLLPYFCPCNKNGGNNCSPLIITPVRNTT